MKNSQADAMQQQIVQILSREVITQQQALLARLQQEGVRVAQATLSRCLRRMGVAKIQGVYQLAHQEQTVLQAVLRVQPVPPNLLVLHTLPGHANSVAVYLDRVRQQDVQQPPAFGNIAATLAGDDTVLVVSQQQHLQQLLQLLQQLCTGTRPHAGAS